METIDDLTDELTNAVERFHRSAASDLKTTFVVWRCRTSFEDAVRMWRIAPTNNLKAHYADLAHKRARTVLNRIKAATS